MAVLVVVWYLALWLFQIPDYVFPHPDQVIASFQQTGWTYLPNAWTTTQEVAAGFGLALLFGLPVATVMAMSPLVRQSLYPVLIASQMVPLFVLAAVLTVVFPYGLLPQVILTTLYSFLPIVVNTADGLGRVDAEFLDLVRSANASSWQVMRLVRIPQALPSVFSGCKLAVVFAVGGATIGELIGGQSGLGYMTRNENGQFDVAAMIATVLVLTVLGLAFFAVVAAAEYVLIPWNRGRTRNLGDLWRGHE
jgi:NitT/TauT family transport system permease protein